MADQRIPVAPAEILAQRTYLAPGKLEITEHTFRVPLDHHSPTSGTIRLFARTTRRPPAARPDPSSASTSAPAPPEKYMVWLNGGPGQSSALPQDYAFTAPLLERGYTLLTLDQRGTGLSTPLTPETLPLHGAVAAQVACLKLHRADSIVRDCEAVRAALFPSQESKWALFGQSFGGFVALSYLSFYPQALSEVFIFGGLAPVACSEPGEVYARLYRRVERRNAAFYAKFPEDVGRVRRVVAALQEGKGGTLTARRFMQLGLLFGFHGRFDRVHDIVLRATTDLDAFGFLTRNTLAVVDAVFAWDECLLYSILHEAIYCQGQQAAANWAAHRLAEHDPRFTHFGQRRLHLPTGPEEPVSTDDESAAATPPLLFTGEMIYPWMFDDCAGLAGVREAAHGLARETDWPPLYDLQQLARNEVPVYAAVYGEDMYVDHDLSMDTAARVKGCKVFATNVWYHNAIRDKCKEVLEQLFALRDDVID